MLTRLVDGAKIPLTEQEIADVEAQRAKAEQEKPARDAERIRKQRDNLLSKTDWWVLPDRTATQEQIDYRQALRDITDHVNFPYLTEADWPVKPE